MIPQEQQNLQQLFDMFKGHGYKKVEQAFYKCNGDVQRAVEEFIESEDADQKQVVGESDDKTADQKTKIPKKVVQESKALFNSDFDLNELKDKEDGEFKKEDDVVMITPENNQQQQLEFLCSIFIKEGQGEEAALTPEVIFDTLLQNGDFDKTFELIKELSEQMEQQMYQNEVVIVDEKSESSVEEQDCMTASEMLAIYSSLRQERNPKDYMEEIECLDQFQTCLMTDHHARFIKYVDLVSESIESKQQEHKQNLDYIKEKFSSLKPETIQGIYGNLLDPRLVIEVLNIGFRNFYQDKKDDMMSWFKESKKVVVQRPQTFWTPAIMEKFVFQHWKNYKDLKYNEERENNIKIAEKLNNQIRECEELAKQAFLRHDHAQVKSYKNKKQELWNDLNKHRNGTEHQIFNLVNQDVMNEIDLHGQYKESAIRITSNILKDVIQNLNSSQLEPNTGDGHNHVWKIICGAGKHSKNGKACLINVIPDLITRKQLDQTTIKEHGVVLVRIEKQIQ